MALRDMNLRSFSSVSFDVFTPSSAWATNLFHFLIVLEDVISQIVRGTSMRFWRIESLNIKFNICSSMKQGWKRTVENWKLNWWKFFMKVCSIGYNSNIYGENYIIILAIYLYNILTVYVNYLVSIKTYVNDND